MYMDLMVDGSAGRGRPMKSWFWVDDDTKKMDFTSMFWDDLIYRILLF